MERSIGRRPAGCSIATKRMYLSLLARARAEIADQICHLMYCLPGEMQICALVALLARESPEQDDLAFRLANIIDSHSPEPEGLPGIPVAMFDQIDDERKLIEGTLLHADLRPIVNALERLLLPEPPHHLAASVRSLLSKYKTRLEIRVGE